MAKVGCHLSNGVPHIACVAKTARSQLIHITTDMSQCPMALRYNVVSLCSAGHYATIMPVRPLSLIDI